VQDESAKKEIEDEFKTVVERTTSDDDTHPSPQDRFRYIEKIRPAEVEHLNGEVWDLFADRAAIKAEMNDMIEKLVRPGHQSSGDGILGIG
jgi:hypothetical protein